MQRQRDELVPVAEVLSDLPIIECDKGSYHTLKMESMSDTGFDGQGITAGTELILSPASPLPPASLFTPTPKAARRDPDRQPHLPRHRHHRLPEEQRHAGDGAAHRQPRVPTDHQALRPEAGGDLSGTKWNGSPFRSLRLSKSAEAVRGVSDLEVDPEYLGMGVSASLAD